MQEIWKDIPGYEGKYQISNFGNVMSLHFRSSNKKKILKPIKKNNYGYLQVNLSKNGKHKITMIHRLVAKAFIPNPENKPVINHLDSNPSNNRADNLEWCTQQENIKYGYSYGNMVPSRPMLGRTGSKSPNSKPVLQIDISTNNVICEFSSIKEAGEILGIMPENICCCCKNKIKTAGGYIWKYKDE